MRKGRIAARVLAAAIAFSLLSQNVATVYADEVVTEEVELQSEEENVEIAVEEPEDSEEVTETPKESEEESAEESKEEESEEPTEEPEEEESEEPAEDSEKETVEETTLSETAKAFLDAWAAFQPQIPARGVASIMNDEDAYAAFAEALAPVDDAFDALTEEDLEQEDVKATVAEYENLFAGSNEIELLDENGTSLQDQIDAAAEGTTVTLKADAQENVKITKAITLDLGGHTLKGDGTNSVVTIVNANGVTVKNGTITGGAGTTEEVSSGNSASGGGVVALDSTVVLEDLIITGNTAVRESVSDGGGVYVENGKLTMKNVQVTDNTASDNGGGVMIINSESEITNCKITGNTSQYGGGMTVNDEKKVTVANTEFSGNRAKATGETDMASGGAIYLGGADVTMTGCTVKNNTSLDEREQGKGSGITVTDSSLTLVDTDVTGNTACFGGGVYVNGVPALGATVTMDGNTVISGNTANNKGGGMYARGTAEIALNGAEVSSNKATKDGGGVYVNKNVTLTVNNNAQVNSNTAGGNGGGVYVAADASVTVENAAFNGNTAGSGTSGHGGGIFAINESMSLTGVTFTNNTAGSNGGGVAVEGCSLTTDKCTFTNNSANQGGAAFVSQGNTSKGSGVIKNATFNGNTAVNLGGGIYQGKDYDLSISDSSFTQNSTTADDGQGQGGAIMLNDGEHQMRNVTFTNNQADFGGAILILGMPAFGSTVTMTDCTLENNKAITAGGAIFLWDNVSETINGGTFTSNEAVKGGAIYQKDEDAAYGAITVDNKTVMHDNKASVGGAIYSEGTLTIKADAQIANNTASKDADDIYSAGKLNLGKVADNLQLTTGCKEDIDGWYDDSEDNRWDAHSDTPHVEEITAGSYTAAKSIKAAHAQPYAVTYDANAPKSEVSGEVKDENKYKENVEFTVSSAEFSRTNYMFLGWNTKADGTGDAYTAGSKCKMVKGGITLYAQWVETNAKLPGDMYVNAEAKTKEIVEVKQGQTVDLTGQIKVTKIQEQLNAIANSYGKAADAVPVSDVEFQFKAVLTIPEGLTLPTDKSTVTTKIGKFTVSDITFDGNKATVTFGADTTSIKTFGQLRELVNSAADQNDGWISITIPAVKVNDNAKVDYHTATGTVEGKFEATAGIKGVSSKEFAFTWTAEQDPEKRDPHTQIADIQATVKVLAATPVVVKHDPPVTKTVSGNPSTAATFTFTLTPDKDTYPLPQKDGKAGTSVTITGSGTAEFGDITFTEVGTYTYKVQETNGGVANYTYDSTVYTVTYVVTNNNGELKCDRTITKADGSKAESCTFSNSYSEPSSPSTPSTPSDGGDGGGSSSTPVRTIIEAGSQIVDTIVDTIGQIFEGGNAEEPAAIEESGAVSATGDDSLMTVYGATAAAAAGVLALWFVKRRRHA